MGSFSTDDMLAQYRAQATDEVRAPMLRGILVLVILAGWVAAAPFSLSSPTPGFGLSLLIIVLGFLCFWILGYSYSFAAGTLLLGLMGTGVGAVWLYPDAPIPLFFNLIVAIGVFAFGPVVGFLSTIAISSLLLYVLSEYQAIAAPEIAWLGILLSWLIFLLTWQGSGPMRTLTIWSWQNYVSAQQRSAQLEESQIKLSQTLKSLDAAYKDLAKTNHKLAMSNSIAEEARQAKAEFVANVSHELRTPINMITGFTEIIMRRPRAYARGGLPPALLADLDIVFRNAQHLSDLINDILDLSQLDVGRMGLVREWVCLADIAASAVATICPLADARGLPIHLEIEPNLPHAFIDATRVRQVMLNLLSNAVRFTESGYIALSVQRHSNRIIVSVHDTGPGIAPQDMAKLFEPFRQVDGSTRRRAGGTGLGLHISRRFAQLHGGDMTVESELGRGTTFHLVLPIDNSVDFSPLKRSASQESAQSVNKGIPYIVVEPQPLLERLLRRYLDNATILTVTSVQEAIELSRSQTTQGIVLRTTHQCESLQLLQEVKEMVYDAPLIACTMPGSMEAYTEERGLAGYLLKPITRIQLLAALERFPNARTLLLVDDDRDFRHLFARMLKTAEKDYVLWQAMSAEEALSILQDRQPDVLFLDVLLPDLNGPLLLDWIRTRENLHDVPIFFITAQDASGSPLVANYLEITHRGGLSADELTRCIQAVGRAFIGAIPPANRTARAME